MNDAERISGATGDLARVYMDVLCGLAPAVGYEKARRLTVSLMDAARVHYVQNSPGLPLMIDGLDCSPGNVRRLMDKAGEK